MESDELSPIVRDEVLEKACAQNAQLEIWTDIGEEPVRYRSRFLALDESTRPPHILIEVPSTTGTLAPLRKGDDFEVFFVIGGQRLAFISQIIARSQYTLNQSAVVNAIHVEFPEAVHRRQRRNFYRYDFLLSETPVLEIGLEREGHRDEQFRWSKTIRNLSAGGLCFILPLGSYGPELARGGRLDLKFTLDLPDREELVEFPLVGEIRSMRSVEIDAKTHTVFGMLFCDMDTPSMIPFRDHLLRFIVAKQRDASRRKAGL